MQQAQHWNFWGENPTLTKSITRSHCLAVVFYQSHLAK
jgi:hypothetical protein